MATLVLTAVGSLIGGPVGGAIGAILGQQVDQSVLGPKRRGPRLGDLSVQTSTYGAALPKLFGTMRVAGTVIWATDLREDRHHSGGKGQASTTTYSYSTSFAVALSARRVRDVRRIWADGKLLRGAGGDWKSAVAAFRLHGGDEDQPADPLIASAEGIGTTPAHRGIAYAVFEGLQLADFGNRIPSLTFEVVADDGGTSAGAVAAELSGGALTGGEALALDGYAASGDSVRGAIEALGAAFALPLADDGARLRIGVDDLDAVPERELGSRAGGGSELRLARDRRAANALPDEVAIAYYDPARDYQAGLQRARRDGIAMRSSRIDLPAAIGANAAKGLAEAALSRSWRQRDRATVRLPWRRMEAGCGHRVQLEGAQWRVANWTLDRMVLELGLERDGPAVATVPAMPGRATAEPDRPPGGTVLHLLDLPAIDGSLASAPRPWVAAAGTEAGWRRAELSLSLDGGDSWTTLGGTAPAAIMGVVAGVPTSGPTTLLDRVTAIEVDLLHEGMALPGGGDAALISGRNLAMVGEELLAFGTAVQIGARRWRIFDLLRGRYGTEAAVTGHGGGERFVMIDAAQLRPVDLPATAIGTAVTVSALGVGDDAAVRAVAIARGAALRPPSPVGLTVTRTGDGTIRLGWCRRSRIGWAWLGGADVPLAETSELYRVTLASGFLLRSIEIGEPNFVYSAAEQAADGLSSGAVLTLSVEQLGTFAPSTPPASLSLTI